MTNILFINPHFRLFSTPTCGGANRSQMFLKALTQVGHVDVVSFWEGETSNLPNCDVIHAGCPEFGPLDSYGRVGKYFRLLAPWNANNIFPINKSIESFCDEFLAKGNYDYVAVRYLFTAAEYGLLKYSDRLIVDVDDNPKNTLLVRAQKASSIWWRWYYRLASISACIMTRIVLPKVYCSFYSNPQQSPSRISVFLHNVSVQCEPLDPVSDNTPKRVLVVGFWSYYPNKHGLSHFLSDIWPNIKCQVPDSEICIVGKNMDDELLQLCMRMNGVIVKGFVEDVVQEYQDARCVVVPIYYGSGTCVKVIETMCLNRPFVSTPCGIRGLEREIRSGEDFMLAKDDVEFAESVVKLLTDVNYGALLSSSALLSSKKYFSQEAFNKVVKDSICKR